MNGVQTHTFSGDGHLLHTQLQIQLLCDHDDDSASIGNKLIELPEANEDTSLFFSGVCVTRSLVLCVCFVDRCLSCPFSFGHCVVRLL